MYENSDETDAGGPFLFLVRFLRGHKTLAIEARPFLEPVHIPFGHVACGKCCGESHRPIVRLDSDWTVSFLFHPSLIVPLATPDGPQGRNRQAFLTALGA